MTARMVLAWLCTALIACQPKVPEQYEQIDMLPAIYPDYVDVTVPVNIAPLTFEVFGGGDDGVVRFSAGGEEIVCGGLKARPDIDDWKSLLAKAGGGDLSVEVFMKADGRWARFKPFSIHVSPDSIDPYISYRLIAPSYVSYEELTINQRCLENYDEQVIVDNMLCSTESGGQCVNCHSYQQYNPQRMLFHARQTHGGTVIAYDGDLEKIDMRHDSLLSAGVYPAWHPWMKIVAFSTNKTMQSFHTFHPNKIEVMDSESDLIIYNLETREVTPVETRPDELEVFPAWAPDGRSLYFCSAHFEYMADSVSNEEMIMRAKEVKYHIYRKAFNPETCTFGPRELVFPVIDGDTTATAGVPVGDVSATLPRLSPDGRWLLFTVGEYGCFHIWHHEADLWMMDLQGGGSLVEGGGNARPLNECNSSDTESYHSWSGNGRWIIFSSRRNDGVFTRPFIAHIDNEGCGSKPFELPSADPDYHLQLLKSYNVPEFMSGPVTISPQTFAAKLKEEGKRVNYAH